MIAVGFISNKNKVNVETISRYSELPSVLYKFEQKLKLSNGALFDLLDLDINMLKVKRNNEQFIFFISPLKYENS